MNGTLGVLLLTATLTLFGCSEAGDDAEGEPGARPELLLSLAGADPMTSAPAQFTLELVFEIGSLEGDDAIGIIQDIAISSDSLLAVTDRMGCRILLFAFPSGTPRGELGRCGEGPGEFSRAGPIAFKGDTLLVFDFRTRRLTHLDLDGNQIRSEIPFPDRTEALYWLVDARPAVAISQERLRLGGSATGRTQGREGDPLRGDRVRGADLSRGRGGHDVAARLVDDPRGRTRRRLLLPEQLGAVPDRQRVQTGSPPRNRIMK